MRWIGGHFKPHRDSEKEDGMFGTLIIQLRTSYRGGILGLNHNGVERSIDMVSP